MLENVPLIFLEKDQAKDFINSYHRQGSTADPKIRSLGLFFENDLIAVAQFCATRTSGKAKKYTTELLRLCLNLMLEFQEEPLSLLSCVALDSSLRRYKSLVLVYSPFNLGSVRLQPRALQ